MNILRQIIVGLLASVLPLLLFLTVIDLGVVGTVGNPTQVKKIVDRSGLYKNVVPALLDQAQKQSGNENSVSLADPVVKNAAEQTLSPEFLKQSTENVINGTYDWLNGKVSQPDFRIDLGSKKSEFASIVADHARQLAGSLPACSRAQTQAMFYQGANFDVFSATCLPLGFTPDSVANNVQADLTSNQNFLKDSVLTADTIKKSGSNQSVFENNLKQVPTAFQWFKRSPFILLVLVVLVVVGIVFISSSRLKGLKRAGVILAVVGLFALAYAWGFNYAVTKKVLPKLHVSNSVVSSDVKNIATEIVHTIDKYYWVVGGIYLVIGAGAITTSWKRHKPTDPKTGTSTTTGDPVKTQHESAPPSATIDAKSD